MKKSDSTLLLVLGGGALLYFLAKSQSAAPTPAAGTVPGYLNAAAGYGTQLYNSAAGLYRQAVNMFG